MGVRRRSLVGSALALWLTAAAGCDSEPAEDAAPPRRDPPTQELLDAPELDPGSLPSSHPAPPESTPDLVAESHEYLGTCPTCVTEGETSKVVWREEGPSTLIHWEPFSDDNGWVHKHDPNASMHIYECTRGHEWSGIHRKACWCGWNSLRKSSADAKGLTVIPTEPIRNFSESRIAGSSSTTKTIGLAVIEKTLLGRTGD